MVKAVDSQWIYYRLLCRCEVGLYSNLPSRIIHRREDCSPSAASCLVCSRPQSVNTDESTEWSAKEYLCSRAPVTALPPREIEFTNPKIRTVQCKSTVCFIITTKMKASNTLAVLLLACGSSLAQTPAGFTPKVTAHLDVVFGTKVVDPPGTALTKSGSDPMASH